MQDATFGGFSGANYIDYWVGLRYCVAQSDMDLDGKIDEMMLFNRSLTASEISTLYNNQSSRFTNPGTQLFQNLNFGTNNTANITIASCGTLMNSNLNASINGGAQIAFSNCQANNVNIPSSTSNANLTIHHYPDSNLFYSPTISGNITIESWSIASADTCTYSSGNWNVNCADNCSITSEVSTGANNINISGLGQFTMTKNVSNRGNITIIGVGGNCDIYCSGGCFI